MLLANNFNIVNQTNQVIGKVSISPKIPHKTACELVVEAHKKSGLHPNGRVALELTIQESWVKNGMIVMVGGMRHAAAII